MAEPMKFAQKGKKATTNNSSSLDRPEENFPETLQFGPNITRETISFWNFEKHRELFCKFIEFSSDLEHPCPLVIDLTTKRKYYLKAHTVLMEALAEAKGGDNFKIVFIEAVPFQGGKRTFYTYEVYPEIKG